MSDPRASDIGVPTPVDGSVRVCLAATAAGVVAAMPGVALTTLGNPAWQTADRERRIAGVTAITDPDGRVELVLHLAVSWPPDPLPKLADDLRRRVQAAAKRVGLADQLGEVNIDIATVEPDDPGAAA